jgi:sugar phosphate isomerase/epimerase
MNFNDKTFADYSNPLDREYVANQGMGARGGVEPVSGYATAERLEEPIFPISKIGQTATEGRQFGTFLDSMQGAIRAGAGSIELQTQMMGTDRAVGAEAYGTEARRELKEIARANQVNITAVHAPTQVGNLSGYTGPERGFNHEQRKAFVEEVKKAINFAADVSQGGAVVLHTGEYQRPISDAKWARDPETGEYMFKGYDEEPYKAVLPLVDDRTGQVLTQVRKNQEVARAVWNTWDGNSAYTDTKGQLVAPGNYVDYNGNKLSFDDRVPKYDPETNRFVIHRERWEDFVKEAEERNRIKERELGRELMPNERILPEEAFIRATTETQERISKGWAGNYANRLDKAFERIEKLREAKEFYAKLESNIPQEEKWKIMKDMQERGSNAEALGLIPHEWKTPLQVIEEDIHDAERDIDSIKEMV